MQKVALKTINRRTFLKSSGLLIAASALPSTLLAKNTKTVLSKNPQLLSETPVLLNFNENVLGASHLAVKAAQNYIENSNRYTLYKDIETLYSKLTQLQRVNRQQLLLVQGSTNAIRASIDYAKNQLGKNTTVQLVVPTLTYEDAAFYSGSNNILVNKNPMKTDCQYDIPAMQKATSQFKGISVVYIVNPNNPTGTILPYEQLEPWIISKPKNVLFIVDEAYSDFNTDNRFRSAIHLVREGYDNLIVTRTFSKLYALAGLRIGYAISDTKNLNGLKQHMGNDINLNRAGVAAAIASLDDQPFLKLSKEYNEQSKKMILTCLDKLNIHYLKPEGNYVFVQLKHLTNKQFIELMQKNNFIIGREFPPADNWVRISFGTQDQMKLLSQKLTELDAKNLL